MAVLSATGPIDFLRSFALQNLGHYDPTASLDADCLQKVFATASGVCLVSLKRTADGVEISCDGADADAVQAELAAALQAADNGAGFTPTHPVLARIDREQPGLRLVRVPWLFDIACSAVLQQRVRATEAMSDWRHIAERFGSRHVSGRAVFPSARELAAVPVWELERLGLDAQRARTLIALAREIRMNPLHAAMTLPQLRGRLSRVPGVGPWTVEMVLGFGAGDADALPTGDLYLPHLVCYALAGENPGTDERMIELLEPYRGHRFRVARLLFGGKVEVPRVSAPRPSGPRTLSNRRGRSM